MYNAGTPEVNAINNWWGDAGGPNLNGDAVYGNVNTTPWRTEASDCVTGVPVNDPPLEPSTPDPANGSVAIPFANGSITLTWSGGDPNPSDTVVYDLRWGTDSANLASLAIDLTQDTYEVSGIQPDTTYHWQIITRDNHGSETSGPVWQFTTAASQPDLVISDLTWTPNSGIVAGQQLTFTITVQNVGPGTVSDNILVGFQIVGGSAYNVWVNDDLATGQSAQATFNWTAQTGTFSVEAVADSNLAIIEDDETNNSRTGDLGVIDDTTPPEMTTSNPAEGASLQTVNQITIDLVDRFGGSIDHAATQATIAVTVDDGLPVGGTTSVSGNRFIFTPDAVPLADGSYQISLTAYDTAGNSRLYTLGFTVDNQVPAAPGITGGTVTSGTLQARPVGNRSNKSTITLTGTRQDDPAVLVNNAQRVGPGSGQWTTNIGLNQGDNTLEIRCRDAAGNISDPVFVDIYVDSVAPAISNIAPAADSFQNSVPTAVTIGYTEASSGIDAAASTHIVKDGSLAEVAGTWTDANSQLQFTPATAFDDDTYTIEMRLVDNLGNAAALFQAVFTVDTTAPPQPKIDPVASPTHTVTQTITGQKEAHAAILLDGQQIINHTAGTTWQHTVTLTSGDNAFSFASQDRSGNQSTANQISIVFDDIAPPAVSNLTADGNGSGTAVALNWTGYNEAAHGDIQTYRVYYETAAFSNVSALTPKTTLSAGTFAHTVDNLAGGTTYWFAVVAEDLMGNFNPAVTAVSATPADTLAPENVTNVSVQSFADRLIFTWQPSADTRGDLAGHKVYLDGGTTPVLLDGATTTYERTALAASSAYDFKISTYDTNDNESSGVSITGYTWLDNPGGLVADPYSGYVQLTWDTVAPASHVKHYAVYVRQGSAFTSVQGMSPAVTTSAPQAKVAGLANNQTYYFAVTAVNRSDGRRPDVTTVSATPIPDESGPEISAVQIDGQPLTNGSSVARPALITLSADDPAGVSRIEFLLDSGPLHIDYNAPFGSELNVLQIADGTHTLDIVGYDTLDNSTTVSYSLNVALEPPAAPSISQPANGLLTNQTEMLVQGQGELETQVTVYLEGQAVAGPMAVDNQGQFSATITLAEGVNRIRAAAQNRSGLGAQSPEVMVTVDT